MARMNDDGYRHEHTEHRVIPRGRFARMRGSALALFDRAIDAGEVNLMIIRRESDLFLGTLLTILGTLNFHSGRYCDGNTADYLSCTRPVTYYYFTWFETGLIIVGIFFIMLWFLKRQR
jgi:hypothetical protein